MIDYLVKNSGAPYFRWVDGAIKARQGNLAAGHKVSGSISGQFGQFLVIPSGLSGEAPLPYAMYLKDLEPVPVEPPVEPPSQGEIQIIDAVIRYREGADVKSIRLVPYA